METMINLNDLLKHEILDLYSAEEQIIEAMPAMIEQAKNPELKKALREHLKITEQQKSRLDKVKELMGDTNGEGEEKKGFFSRLFGGGSGGEKCRGMEGLITEGEKIMGADITDEALDAAIIASAQKIEHYEICGYGTARAFARELQLAEVERLLSETLNEEYKSDDLLTALAVGKLNVEAERADGMEIGDNARSNRTGGNGSRGDSKSSGGGSSKSSSKGGSSKGAAKGSSGGLKNSSKGGSSKVGKKSSANKGGTKGSSKSSSKSGSSKAGSKAGSKRGNTSKTSVSKGSSKSGSSRVAGKSGGNKGGAKKASSRGR